MCTDVAAPARVSNWHTADDVLVGSKVRYLSNFGAAPHFGERPESAQLRRPDMSRRRTGFHVRRDKAALSSGCKAHPAIRSRRKQPGQAWR